MKIWMRKISVILVAIMTLGLYIPPAYVNTNAEESKSADSSKSDFNEEVFTSISNPVGENEMDVTLDHNEPDELSNDDYYIQIMAEKAKEQTITKLGPRIVNHMDEEFMADIYSNMEEVLAAILTEDDSVYYGITERPSKGFGEKIFNVYDVRTNKDIAKFHVRRDKRPLEGYWFNFHYHVSTDGFLEHHEIGEVFWDKNIPPKWMA
ncbi:YpjP family protein [Virgibacillus byunsanensis]|uniref:YpjP family protein n=1 Tax=Virgibacillus byunsanensis TaxID=570945 RepID=A0ABW3LNS6_9BACI